MRYLIILLLLVAAGCTTQAIPNGEICLDEEMPLTDLGAFCQFTRPPQTSRHLTRAQWDAIRFGRFSMDAKTLGEYQIFVKTACNNDQDCTDQAAQYNQVLGAMQTKVQQDKAGELLRLSKPLFLPPPLKPDQHP